MDKKLKSSFKRHQEIFFLISQTFLTVNIRKFEFNVEIPKKKYLDMVKQRYISMLLNFSNKQILDGMKEIDNKYGEVLNKNLQVMDATAIAFCRDNKLPIMVLDYREKDSILKAVCGESVGTYIK